MDHSEMSSKNDIILKVGLSGGASGFHWQDGLTRSVLFDELWMF